MYYGRGCSLLLIDNTRAPQAIATINHVYCGCLLYYSYATQVKKRRFLGSRSQQRSSGRYVRKISLQIVDQWSWMKLKPSTFANSADSWQRAFIDTVMIVPQVVASKNDNLHKTMISIGNNLPVPWRCFKIWFAFATYRTTLNAAFVCLLVGSIYSLLGVLCMGENKEKCEQQWSGNGEILNPTAIMIMSKSLLASWFDRYFILHIFLTTIKIFCLE